MNVRIDETDPMREEERETVWKRKVKICKFYLHLKTIPGRKSLLKSLHLIA